MRPTEASRLSLRELDRRAIEGHGIPGYTLMSRAGEIAFEAARARWPLADRWLVVCGAGNNAGDGYVIARLARAAGLRVDVVAASDPTRLGGDAARAWADFESAGGTTCGLEQADFIGQFPLPATDVPLPLLA